MPKLSEINTNRWRENIEQWRDGGIGEDLENAFKDELQLLAHIDALRGELAEANARLDGQHKAWLHDEKLLSPNPACGHAMGEAHAHTDACYSPVPETDGKGSYLSCQLTADKCRICREKEAAVAAFVERVIAHCNLDSEGYIHRSEVTELITPAQTSTHQERK